MYYISIQFGSNKANVYKSPLYFSRTIRGLIDTVVEDLASEKSVRPDTVIYKGRNGANGCYWQVVYEENIKSYLRRYIEKIDGTYTVSEWVGETGF